MPKRPSKEFRIDRPQDFDAFAYVVARIAAIERLSKAAVAGGGSYAPSFHPARLDRVLAEGGSRGVGRCRLGHLFLKRPSRAPRAPLGNIWSNGTRSLAVSCDSVTASSA